MAKTWQDTFRLRMRRFQAGRRGSEGGAAVSIKIRVSSGCFHREHSPRAYEFIDDALSMSPEDAFSFQEHESGPELLVYIGAAAAGVSLAASVINLVTAIIKARSEGTRKGDRPSDPLELIIRRIDEGEGFREETVLRIAGTDRVQKKQIADTLNKAVRKLLRPRKQQKI